MILELLLFHIMLLLSSPPNYVLAEPRALLAASNSSSTNRNVTISLPFSNREDCYYDEVWYEMVVALDILQTSPGDVGFQKPNFVFSQTRNFCRIASDSLAFMAYNSTDFIINDGWCQLPASLHRIMFSKENHQDGEGLNLINSRYFQRGKGIIKLGSRLSCTLRWKIKITYVLI